MLTFLSFSFPTENKNNSAKAEESIKDEKLESVHSNFSSVTHSADKDPSGACLEQKTLCKDKSSKSSQEDVLAEEKNIKRFKKDNDGSEEKDDVMVSCLVCYF